jgi:hypothetical protein
MGILYNSHTKKSTDSVPFFPRILLSEFGKEVWLLLDDQQLWWRECLITAWVETRDVNKLSSTEILFFDLLPPKGHNIIILQYGLDCGSLKCWTEKDSAAGPPRTIEYSGEFTFRDKLVLYGKLRKRLKAERSDPELLTIRKMQGQVELSEDELFDRAFP